jgi:hypothetical protein
MPFLRIFNFLRRCSSKRDKLKQLDSDYNSLYYEYSSDETEIGLSDDSDDSSCYYHSPLRCNNPYCKTHQKTTRINK